MDSVYKKGRWFAPLFSFFLRRHSLNFLKTQQNLVPDSLPLPSLPLVSWLLIIFPPRFFLHFSFLFFSIVLFFSSSFLPYKPLHSAPLQNTHKNTHKNTQQKKKKILLIPQQKFSLPHLIKKVCSSISFHLNWQYYLLPVHQFCPKAFVYVQFFVLCLRACNDMLTSSCDESCWDRSHTPFPPSILTFSVYHSLLFERSTQLIHSTGNWINWSEKKKHDQLLTTHFFFAQKKLSFFTTVQHSKKVDQAVSQGKVKTKKRRQGNMTDDWTVSPVKEKVETKERKRRRAIDQRAVSMFLSKEKKTVLSEGIVRTGYMNGDSTYRQWLCLCVCMWVRMCVRLWAIVDRKKGARAYQQGCSGWGMKRGRKEARHGKQREHAKKWETTLTRYFLVGLLGCLFGCMKWCGVMKGGYFLFVWLVSWLGLLSCRHGMHWYERKETIERENKKGAGWVRVHGWQTAHEAENMIQCRLDCIDEWVGLRSRRKQNQRQ